MLRPEPFRVSKYQQSTATALYMLLLQAVSI